MWNIKLQIKGNLEMINLYKTSIKNAKWISISQIPEKKLKISVLLSENEDLRLELHKSDRVVEKNRKVFKNEEKTIFINHLYKRLKVSELTESIIEKEELFFN